MLSKSQNDALLIVGNAANEHKEWVKYAEYCVLRERGLRKEAFKILDEFLIDAGKWEETDRIKFIEFLMPYSETVEDADYGPLPSPIREKLIKPTLEKWCDKETENSNPFRWYGELFCHFEYLEKALIINPKDDLARKVLLNWGTAGLDYATHHMPDYYIGDYNEDLKSISLLKEHVNKLSDSRSREIWSMELDDCAKLVINYAEWKASGHPDLIKWGKENQKCVSSGSAAYYYTK
ncbi:MAG: hypothetical protein LBR56_01180 [Sporomusaceae bacterium]|jgi:hypothetical protein|nr:hypothetical protein [Sporomusaceae bacterium]